MEAIFMALRKKLVKHGNSYALVIDKPILDLLDINVDEELELTVEGGKLEVSPVGALELNGVRDEVMVAFERVKARHADTFRRLAE